MPQFDKSEIGSMNPNYYIHLILIKIIESINIGIQSGDLDKAIGAAKLNIELMENLCAARDWIKFDEFGKSDYTKKVDLFIDAKKRNFIPTRQGQIFTMDSISIPIVLYKVQLLSRLYFNSSPKHKEFIVGDDRDKSVPFD